MIKRLIFGYFLYELFFSEKQTNHVGKITSHRMRIVPAPVKLVKKKCGCYIIRGKKTVLFVGYGDDVYQAVNSHFDGSDANQYNDKHDVEILLTTTFKEAELLYKGLISHLKPMDYDGSYSIKITKEIQELLDLYDGMA